MTPPYMTCTRSASNRRRWRRICAGTVRYAEATVAPAIDEQDVHLYAGGAQPHYLLLHEGPQCDVAWRGVHVGDR